MGVFDNRLGQSGLSVLSPYVTSLEQQQAQAALSSMMQQQASLQLNSYLVDDLLLLQQRDKTLWSSKIRRNSMMQQQQRSPTSLAELQQGAALDAHPGAVIKIGRGGYLTEHQKLRAEIEDWLR